MADNVRYICGISGGKDSSAMAVWLRQNRPELDVEYFFCDTGAELPETYEYLTELETVLGKEIVRLNSNRGFDHYFEIYRGTLPSPQMRWCTKVMKIKPLEQWVGEDEAVSFVAIRADESNRKGYISTKGNIRTEFPFIDNGITKDDVLRLLENAGIGLPSYYEWRTRSGCYFCFYQRKAEWVGLADRHPELFERARQIEKKVLGSAGADGDADYTGFGTDAGDYTWSQGESLDELIARRDEILANHYRAMERAKSRRENLPLVEVLNEALDEEDDSDACAVCAF